MNDVIVKVVGRQRDEFGEENTIAVTALGKHYFKNGINYVRYDEKIGDDNLNVNVLLKIAGNKMTVVRRGNIRHEQCFEKNTRHESEYATPYGSMKLSVFTKDIVINYGGANGDVRIKYDIASGGRKLSQNELYVTISADKNICQLN
jgi:uncharacterized beta-barrel protein YwiB (DUF1934 family)